MTIGPGEVRPSAPPVAGSRGPEVDAEPGVERVQPLQGAVDIDRPSQPASRSSRITRCALPSA